jgi:hypothetical protein
LICPFDLHNPTHYGRSRLEFKFHSSLLSTYQILKRSHHFCDNINIFQCIEGVYWKQCFRFVFNKDCLPSFVKMAAFWVEMEVAYLEINKLPCLHEIDIPKCINVYSIYRTKVGVIGFFVLSFLIPSRYICMCFRASSVFVLSILFWFPQCTHCFWHVFRFLFMEHKQDYSVTSVKDVKVCF